MSISPVSNALENLGAARHRHAFDLDAVLPEYPLLDGGIHTEMCERGGVADLDLDQISGVCVQWRQSCEQQGGGRSHRKHKAWGIDRDFHDVRPTSFMRKS